MDKLKKNIVNRGFGVAALIGLFLFVFFCLVMGELTESLVYYPIVEEDGIVLSDAAYQYSDSSLFAVADSAYEVFSATFNPGLANYNVGKVLKLIDLYAFVVVEGKVDTTFESGRRGISNGTIRWWIMGKDSGSTTWSLLSDTAVMSDPGSLFVADTMFGYIAIDTIKYVPFDIKYWAKCDSDSVGYVRARSDSRLEGKWRSGEGRYQ